MGIDDSIRGVVEDFASDDSRAAEDDEIEVDFSDVRHHVLRVVDRDFDVWNLVALGGKFGQLRLDRWGDWVSLDALEELLSLLVADGRVLGDDDGWDEAF